MKWTGNVSPASGSLFALLLATLLASSQTVYAQSAGNATLRGTVADQTGGVLPGATVTLTNSATRAIQTSDTDARGAYLFSGVFPGTYDVRVQLDGFKTFEQIGLVINPQDTRGLDITLLVGEQSERVTVKADNDAIQTETGAREGVLTAPQIDNLSVISRSALELLRILPGVVAPYPSELESVSFDGGANRTSGYTINGVRGTNNTVQLDGSSLIDIGTNNGSIITLNNDMVQEVKVQSANYAAQAPLRSAQSPRAAVRASTASCMRTTATTTSRRTIARTTSSASRSRRARSTTPVAISGAQ